MTNRLLFFALFCAHQPFMHSAAGSSQLPRPSGLALMRLQPEFRPIVVGYDDNSNFTSKTVLTEVEIGTPGFASRDEDFDLERGFCNILIRGATPELREKMLEGALKKRAHTNFVARAAELKSDPYYKRTDPHRKLDYKALAQEDAQEFPDFYQIPKVHESWSAETLCGQFNKHLDLTQIEDPNFEKLFDFSVLVTYLRLADSTKTFLSWSANDEEKTLTQGQAVREPYSPWSHTPYVLQFVMHNKEGQELLKKFLARSDVKELRNKKENERVIAALIHQAKMERVKLCGVAIIPHDDTKKV